MTRTYIVADKKANEIDEASDLISSNVIDEDFSVDSIPEDAAKRLYEYDGESVLVNNKLLSSSEGNPGKDRFALTSGFYSSAGLDYDALAVTISEDLDLDGNITLTLYNTYKKQKTASSAGDRYTLILPFGADRSVSTSTKTENVSSTAEDDDSKYTVKTKTTETTITTLTWHLTGIKTDF